MEPEHDFATVPDLVASLHCSSGRVVFCETGGELAHVDIPAAAERGAARLRSVGVGKGDVVGLLVPTSAEFICAFFAVLLTGAAVAALPIPPVVMDPVDVAARVVPSVRKARMRFLLVHGVGEPVGQAVSARLNGHGESVEGLLCSDLLAPLGAPVPNAAGMILADVPQPEDIALIQFSSGSTSDPKGVMLSHRAVLAALSSTNARVQTVPSDVVVGWVPLFHDLGLITLLSSLAAGIEARLFSPISLVRAPEDILRDIARSRGTITGGPNFAFDRMLSAAERLAPEEELDLSCWRIALNGGETVRPETVRRFRRILGPRGVSSATMYPGYGLAEATLGVTLPLPGVDPRVLTIDRRSLAPGSPVEIVEDATPGMTELVGLGVPVPEIELFVLGPDGTALPERHLGELCIRGTTVTSGYLHDPEATERAFTGGLLHTGDLGFIDNRELFIAGRVQEMIIVRGRNIFPYDVENVVRDVIGVYHGHCVAVARPEAEEINVVVESASYDDADSAAGLIDAVRAAVAARLDVHAIVVEIVAPLALPRTTSGKWKRNQVRAQLAPQIARLETPA
ncbi:acyl-CoA synthetase (AMP-forming)/AMP-acid ligase II [Jatrophihabitans sp. GAS493]|nr:acyl-CoA synthetase (AMP-forming)/AMP-acid ligase II [Jatrophihabitans sp. GAS493]